MIVGKSWTGHYDGRRKKGLGRGVAKVDVELTSPRARCGVASRWSASVAAARSSVDCIGVSLVKMFMEISFN